MEKKMIKLRNLAPEVKEWVIKVVNDLLAQSLNPGKKEEKVEEKKEVIKKKRSRKKVIALLVAGAFLFACGVADARIMDRNVDTDAGIVQSKIDITSAPENTEYTLDNEYLMLPTIATSSMPAAASGNEGGLYYDNDNDKLYFSDGSSWAAVDTSGSTTAYDDIGNPDANGAIDFTTYTNTWDMGGVADMFVIELTGAFADVSGVVVEQKTGNPTDGTLVELKLAVGESDPDFLSLLAGASEVWNINASGDLVNLGDITCVDLTTSGATSFTGNVDIGDGSSDTLTIAGIIDGDVTLDDGVGGSPSLILKDVSDETGTFAKQDGSDLTFTIVAADAFRIVTGNLRVGNGSPGTAAMDGEDAYVEGELEVDGAAQFDSTVIIAGALTSSAGASFGDQAISNVGEIAVDTIVGDGTTIGIGLTAAHDVSIGNSTGNLTVLGDNIDFTLTDTTDNAFQLVNSGGAILLDIDLGADDTIDLGDAGVKLAIVSSAFNVSTAGVVSGATGITTTGAVDADNYTCNVGAGLDSQAAGSLLIGAVTATSVEIADSGVTTDIQGPVTVLSEIDTAGADALILGKATATSVEIADSGVTTDIQGPITVLSEIDTAAAGALILAKATATSVEIAATGVETDIQGTLSVDESVVFDSTIAFEGSTADAYDTTITADDPTVNRAITLPDYAGAIPLVVYNGTAAVDCTGVGATTDITGSSLTLADGWFASGKSLKWTIYGRSDGSGSQAMALQLYVDNAAFGSVALTTGQSDSWVAEFILDEHTDFANQDIVGILYANTDPVNVTVATDTTDFNDGGTTTVKLQGTTNSGTDHIYIDHIRIEHFCK